MMQIYGYYLNIYRLAARDHYFIWRLDDIDGVIVDENGAMLTFESCVEAEAYAQSQGIALKEAEPEFYDLDAIVDWITNPDPANVDCSRFNSAWNLFTDVAASTRYAFDTDIPRTRKVYDKLFWGCNLPAVTPEGCSYEPIWLPDEIALLCEVLRAGMVMMPGYERQA